MLESLTKRVVIGIAALTIAAGCATTTRAQCDYRFDQDLAGEELLYELRLIDCQQSSPLLDTVPNYYPRCLRRAGEKFQQSQKTIKSTYAQCLERVQ